MHGHLPGQAVPQTLAATDVDGGVATGGMYAIEISSSGNRFLGVQPTADDFTPGTITLTVTNNTGGDLLTFTLAYTRWVRNDQNRGNSWDVLVSSDGQNYISLPDFMFTSSSSADPQPTFQSQQLSTTVTLPTPVAGGSDFYIRWETDDVNGSGSRDEFGIDDIQLTNAVLPIRLVSFTGKIVRGLATLTWETSSESNLDHFTIEKSLDNGLTFFHLTNRLASGSRKQSATYQVVDRSRMAASTIYKLSTVELDGSIFPQALVQLHSGQANWNLFPTVVEKSLTVTTNGPTELLIFSLNGQLINSIVISGIHKMDVSHFESGLYLVRRSTGQFRSFIKS